MELAELIASIDIVEYISQYVNLEQRGSEWWGLSPFKQEKTPSFSVRQDPPFFYDYAAGLGGNVYHFVRQYHRCSGREAVEILKNYTGLTGDLEPSRPKLAATMVCKKYMKPKAYTKAAKGVKLPDDYMDRYEKREDKLAVWEREGISRRSLDKFQVYYDGFSDRLVYPIRDLSGNIVNVGGRTLNPQYKEKEMRKYTYFFPWGAGMKVIYGLYENLNAIKQAKEIILFEGCKSVLIADTWGIGNTACLLTSHLNPSQMKTLAWLGCRVVFALDKEINIRDDKNIQKLKNYVNCEYLWDKDGLLNDKDSPVDKGRDVFNKLYAHRLRLR